MEAGLKIWKTLNLEFYTSGQDLGRTKDAELSKAPALQPDRGSPHGKDVSKK